VPFRAFFPSLQTQIDFSYSTLSADAFHGFFVGNIKATFTYHIGLAEKVVLLPTRNY
jgi:hypothetical protein